MNPLILRVPKGSDLTNLEIDDNFRKLRAAINSLEATVAGISAAGTVLPGFINMYGGTAQPTGHLFCNGQAVSRTTYATLFSIIGISYGAGDGTSTFNLPDCRASFAMGANPMGGLTRGGFSARAIGTNYGAESVTVPHTHTASGTVTMNEFTVTVSGTVTVDDFVGSKSVTVASANINYTPAGAIEVVIANHEDTIAEEAPGHKHTVTLPSVSVNTSEPTTNVVPSGVYDTSEHIVEIPLDLAHSILTQTFTGTLADLTHSHPGSSVDIGHGHTASFTGDDQDITPTGSAAITVNSSSPTVSVIPPSWVCNFIIKF